MIWACLVQCLMVTKLNMQYMAWFVVSNSVFRNNHMTHGKTGGFPLETIPTLLILVVVHTLVDPIPLQSQ